ncbi:MAG: uncharacterized protein A8A55_0200 [Amphiamblys sp. WSBS2006]|nr:MAG: uncharacterized protein A8A55_0200 [Amphiamblys sp. WSBS2006]
MTTDFYEDAFNSLYSVRELQRRTGQSYEVILYVLFYSSGSPVDAAAVLDGTRDLLWCPEDDEALLTKKDMLESLNERYGLREVLQRVKFLDEFKKGSLD